MEILNHCVRRPVVYNRYLYTETFSFLIIYIPSWRYINIASFFSLVSKFLYFSIWICILSVIMKLFIPIWLWLFLMILQYSRTDGLTQKSKVVFNSFSTYVFSCIFFHTGKSCRSNRVCTTSRRNVSHTFVRTF